MKKTENKNYESVARVYTHIGNLRNEKGITLIALIITIIVLLILAGITIQLLNESGIFSKTELAKEKTLKSQAIEKVKLAVMASYKENGQLLYGNLNEKMGLENNLNMIEGLSPKLIENITTFPIVVNVDGYNIIIEENGIVEFNDENNNNNDSNDNNDNSNKDKEKESLVFLEHFEDNWEGIPANKISTENKRLGNGSLSLNSTEITNNNTTEFVFSSDFTIDYWLNLDSSNLNSEWVPILVVGNTGGMWMGLHSGKFTVRGYSLTDYLTIEPPTIGEWVHVAVTRKDGIIYVFYNGILKGQVNNTINFTEGQLYIGSDGMGGYAKNSYIDELRVIKGNAKWITNFTVPTTEYNSEEEIIYHFNYSEIIANTSILSKEEKKFGNYSKYFNDTYTNYQSDEKYQLESDFTIDYWLKLDSSNLNSEWVPILVVGNTGGMWMGLHSGKFIVRGYSLTDYLTIEPPTIGEWVHIAVTRQDGIIYVFYNGVLQGQVNNTTIFTQGMLDVGSDGEGSYTKNSYIDELRILNGYCAWTKDFSVPSSEYKY